MTYKQLVTPNLDPEIREGNQVLSDWLGWCLAYAKNAYGAFGATGDTAWKAWNATQFKHDSEVPVGVYAPIWFSGYQGMGHVSILYKRPDGQTSIWSSPISHKPYADVWGSIGEIERRYGVKYVGWSEDIAGVKVIESGAEMIDTNTKAADLLSLATLNPHPTDEAIKSIINQPYEVVVPALLKNGEHIFVVDQFNKVPPLEAENKALKEQIANPPQNPDQVIITKDSLWAKFKKLIGA